MSSADVVIVGGGVIGLTTAYYCARAGLRVTLVEAGPIGRQASWAGAGILPPASLTYAQTPMDRLRALSNAEYPRLTAQLAEDTGLDNGYRVCGGIELVEPGQSVHRVPTEEWYSPGARCEMLQGPALQQRLSGWSLAAEINGGAWLPEMAQVRNPWHLRALQAACRVRGVDLRPHWPVRRLLAEGVEGEEGVLRAERIVLTSGAWTAQLIPIPIRPVRGQMLLLRIPAGNRPILTCGKRYLVPRGDGRLLVGSTEEDVGFDASTTAEALSELRQFAVSLCPALADAPIEGSWAGLRPASADGVPYLGPVPGQSRWYVAAGHFRAGLHLSPGTALYLCRLFLGQPEPFDAEAFRLDR
ncbi:MAG: glycine oxidase ThiO [Gemmataceae bacterium]